MMLKPLVRQKLAVWDDTTIKPGVKWKDNIEGALATAKVAVLLVSPNFLGSDFIVEHELPPLLDAAETQGLVILWVYVSSCVYEETEIGRYQAAHETSKPLDALTPAEQGSVLSDVCRKIKAAVGSSQDHPSTAVATLTLHDHFFLVRSASPNHGPDLSPALCDNGCLRLFLPSDNDVRNSYKKQALLDAMDIRLLAHSGHSYLASAAARFQVELCSRLRAGARFRAILLHPWTDTSLAIALAERAPADTPTDTTCLETQKLPNEPVALIEKSIWKSLKFTSCILGYQQLRNEFADNIEIRFSSLDIPATILLTEYQCFYEPYLHVNLRERLRSGMLTFELQVTDHADLFRHSSQYFAAMWQHALSYDEFIRTESEIRQRFKERHRNMMGRVRSRAMRKE